MTLGPVLLSTGAKGGKKEKELQEYVITGIFVFF